VLEPGTERRSVLFRGLVRHVLSGLRAAARLTCDSEITRAEVLRHELCSPERVVVVPNGVDAVFSPTADPLCDEAAARLLGPRSADAVEILHVGTTVPRKRLDVLLRAFARLRAERPDARLVRVGGPFTAEQEFLVKQLGLEQEVTVLPRVSREVLAAVYRRATLVVLPSEREGFGLPVLEAMASGTPVLASDLAVLRGVGDGAVTYAPVADVRGWESAMVQLLRERQQAPEEWTRRRERGMAQAGKFSWDAYTKRMVDVYREVLGTGCQAEGDD
jgi:glycosyltransferase involved in cell wall biosynthesis